MPYACPSIVTPVFAACTRMCNARANGMPTIRLVCSCSAAIECCPKLSHSVLIFQRTWTKQKQQSSKPWGADQMLML